MAEKNPIVTMKTNQGEMKIELYPEIAPNTEEFYLPGGEEIL